MDQQGCKVQSETIIVALLVSIVAPSILAVGNARINEKRQKLQWTREDEIEARNENRARLAEERAAESNNKLKSIQEQTTVIHSLVNSELTKAYERDLKSVSNSRLYLQTIVEMKTIKGQSPEQSDIEELAALDTRIDELQSIILSRLSQQAEIDKQIADRP